MPLERVTGRVLVIDDDASLRFALEAVLGDAGLTVVTCSGGAAGLQAFETNGADAVLTDLAMPGMLQLAVLFARRPHARIIRLDPSRAPVLVG